MYFLKTDIFVSRNRYIFLKTNVFLQNLYFVIQNRYIFLKTNVFPQNWYFCIPKQVYISENQCISSKFIFCNPKQVYISENQCISSKLIFLYSETGIYFWNTKHFFKINIRCFHVRYIFLETNILLQNITRMFFVKQQQILFVNRKLLL